MNRENLIAFVCGRKRTGKSTLLREVFIAAHPRVISLDFTYTGEVLEDDAQAIPAYSLAELADVLGKVAAQASWHIAAEISPKDALEVVRMLAPMSRTAPSYSRAVRGVAIACGEIDALAPVYGVDPAMEHAIKRGRHYLLSWFMGTQRPHAAARIVTSQADVIAAFAQHEPRDIAWLGEAMSRPIADEVRRLPMHHHVWYDVAEGIAYVRDEQRTTYRALTTFGDEVRA